MGQPSAQSTETEVGSPGERPPAGHCPGSRVRPGSVWLDRLTVRLGRLAADLNPMRWATGTAGEAVAARRVRMLSRWVEISARLVRLPNAVPEASGPAAARELLAGFLREELGATSVTFLPAGLSAGGVGELLLELTGTDEVAQVRFDTRRGWGVAELGLARKAAGMTGQVIATLDALAVARAQSVTDPLTGLYNRRSLDRLLEREVLLARRHGVPLSVGLVDLDHFKQVNDRLGHAEGDRVLHAFGATLSGCLRRTDLAFRIGGDEFVVVLPQTPLASAVAAMEKVRRAWSQADICGKAEREPRLGVTLSIGIAEYRPGMTPAALLAAADTALYDAKRSDRNCVRVREMAA